MLKESLKAIVESRLDLGDGRKKVIDNIIEKFDETEVFYILTSPMGIITEDLSISFYPGVGFRCTNDVSKVGHLPICNIYQKILNNKYEELINNEVS